MQERLIADGVNGSAHLQPGSADAALLEYRTDSADGHRMGNYIVVEMSEGQIAAMREYRRRRRARRAAAVV